MIKAEDQGRKKKKELGALRAPIMTLAYRVPHADDATSFLILQVDVYVVIASLLHGHGTV